MAYVPQTLTEEEKLRQQQGSPEGLGQTGPISGESGLLSSGAPAQAPAGQASPTSSGWTNLRAYLDANKEQGMELTGRVAGSIQKQGDEAKGAIEKSSGDYNAALEKSRVSPNSEMLGAAAADPAGFVKNPSNVESFNKMKSGLFDGPSTFQTFGNYGEVAKKAEEASKLPETIQSSGGQRESIRSLSPNMTAGQLDLNELIVSGTPGSRETLAQTAKPFAGLRSMLETTGKTADSEREKAISSAQAAGKQVQEQFVVPQGQTLADLQKTINARASEASKDQTLKNSSIGDLENWLSGKGALTPDEESMFGLSSSADQSGIVARATQLLNQIDPSTAGYWARPQQAQAVVDYVLGKRQVPVNGAGQPTELWSILKAIDALKPELKKYPTLYVSKNPDPALISEFPGLMKSEGATDPAAVSSMEEMAKILALQQLLGDAAPFFSPEQASMAGTYKPARISKWGQKPNVIAPWNPLITNGLGIA